jgi:hypothetical protein
VKVKVKGKGKGKVKVKVKGGMREAAESERLKG